MGKGATNCKQENQVKARAPVKKLLMCEMGRGQGFQGVI